MPVNIDALNQAITNLQTEVDHTRTVEASAVALFNGFADRIKQAVTDALTVDAAANQGSIDAATNAVDQVTSQFNAAANDLGLAVTNNTPQAPAPTPAP